MRGSLAVTCTGRRREGSPLTDSQKKRNEARLEMRRVVGEINSAIASPYMQPRVIGVRHRAKIERASSMVFEVIEDWERRKSSMKENYED